MLFSGRAGKFHPLSKKDFAADGSETAKLCRGGIQIPVPPVHQ